MVESPYDQFEQWLVKQPFWVQDATWRLYNKRPIDDSQIGLYAQMCLDQTQNKEVEFQHINKDVFGGVANEPQIAIKSIHDVTGVNALAENTSLSFGEKGVSVVYGLNGAGKSGFMRIFKNVSGHPYAEQIQQNIFRKAGATKPFCRFDIAIGEEYQTVEMDLTAKGNNPFLRQCDVFDTRISTAYISSANSVSYEPFVFTVLKELAVIAARIQHVIQDKIGAIPELQLSCPDFIRKNAEATWLEQLTEKSTIPEECIVWKETDAKRIDELNKLLDTQQVRTSIKNKEYQRNQIRKIYDEVHGISKRIAETVPTTFQAQYEALQKAKAQYELAKTIFTDNATEQDKQSVSVADFKALWKAGRSYYEKCIHMANGNGFAKPGSVCPLCLQRVEGDSLQRFASVDEYINGSFSEAYSSAEKRYKSTLESIIAHTYTLAQIKDSLSGLVSKELISQIIDLYKQFDVWEAAPYSESTFNDISAIGELALVATLNGVITALETEIDSLKAALNEEKQEEYKKELQHLKYRHWVYQQQELIQSIIQNDKRKKELEAGQQLLKTNRITSESNQLAEALITDAYIERFNKEMKVLAPYLKVKLEKGQSQKGRSPYKVVLDTTDKLRKSPEDVLSEGEQRIVALAAFFADATGRNEQTPIIIDDPISSLDYNYEEAATRRIVELAKERQVIVFTHRISLLVGLGEVCEASGIPFTGLYIRGTHMGKGVPDFTDAYHGKVDKQLNGLAERIREIQRMDPYSREYQDACSRVSQQLRICVERSVEDILLQQMVKRFSRRIMTGKLMKLDRITSEDCEMIDSMMTKYSFNEHSQPEDSPLIQMDLNDTVSDIKAFITWIKEYNKKMGK